MYNNCGLSFFENENYADAINDFTKAIKKSGGNVAVHYNNRGLALFHLKEDKKEALEDFEKAI